MSLSFFVHGEPATAGSKRAFVYTPKDGGKPRAIVTDDVDTKGRGKTWRAAVQGAALEALAASSLRPFERGVALRVRLTFVLPRPASISAARRAFPVARPDVDKLSRAVLDALKHVTWPDDSQVVSKIVTKRYPDVRHDTLQHVGVWVTVEQEPLPGQVYADVQLDVHIHPSPGTSAALPGLR